MASNEDVQDALREALISAAKDAGQSSGFGIARAESAKNLAEALAWVRSPSQPHGGGVKVEKG